jgi:hypothetical protein
MNVRDQVISYLLQQCDVKDSVIAGMQKEKAELEKKVSEYEKLTPVETKN